MKINLFDIENVKLRAVIKTIADQLDLLQGATNAAAWRGDVNAGSKKLSNLGAAEADTDAVTLAQLRAATNLQNISTALQAGGSNPINITNLPGSGGTLSSGTHAQRLLTPAVAGNWFFETDRTALYGVIGSSWVLMAGNQGGSDAAKPGDLGLGDEGYLWFSQDRGTLLRWTGASWRWVVGTYTDVFANQPTAGTLSASTGVFFSASDRGYQTWMFDRTGPKWTFVGGGSPTRNTLANITTGLTADDAGYLFMATDFDRVYRWTGAAWEDAPGQPAREFIQLFNTAPTGNGWQLCNGAVGVTISTATGGTTTLTVPNLNGATTFLAGGAAVGTGTFAAVGAAYAYATFLPYMRL